MDKNDSPKTYKRLGQVARTKVLVKRKEGRTWLSTVYSTAVIQ